ncbi:MAG: hypothetical protein IPM79_19465 [Polyangiaceae bacterium]|jgi:hypothetical protein|nr:hypothetical protein [Polyangiaceae bacterium]
MWTVLLAAWLGITPLVVVGTAVAIAHVSERSHRVAVVYAALALLPGAILMVPHMLGGRGLFSSFAPEGFTVLFGFLGIPLGLLALVASLRYAPMRSIGWCLNALRAAIASSWLLAAAIAFLVVVHV